MRRVLSSVFGRERWNNEARSILRLWEIPFWGALPVCPLLPLDVALFRQFLLVSAPFGVFPVVPLLPVSPKGWVSRGANCSHPEINPECERMCRNVGFTPCFTWGWELLIPSVLVISHRFDENNPLRTVGNPGKSPRVVDIPAQQWLFLRNSDYSRLSQP